MITNRELSEVMLSPTKKDYYQIWNELMELAEKISERWSPASTNESDPGIVLLKALTAIADKLNYNIDKNTLEAFMPSATQEESMRKLTEMMGYDMKYYQSATTKAVISYKSSNDKAISEFEQGIYFPKFVNLKNEDEDINYVTLEDFTLQKNVDSREVKVIEGEIIDCETNNDNIITALHLDDLNRYILPEYTIAENGIFITNIKDTAESDLWVKEQNLNVQQPGAKIYKFGFDSSMQLPYIQFPDDIKTIIEDGIKIRYIRTNGLSGNISARVLSKLEKPALWSTASDENIKNLAADSFSITNNSAASNGANPESLNSAYNNYKKTVGTFNTLVTCRDYMNKIYQMTESDVDTTPLVSNIIVSDIRDDINRSTPICTFNEYGICYKDVSLKEPITIQLTDEDGEVRNYISSQNKIEHFDLVFYPFKTVYGLNTKSEYKNSFTYNSGNLQKIQSELELNKTVAHNIVQHIVGKDDNDIACIKNYLKLKAKITTTKKVTLVEESEILNNIYKAIYTNFNARQIDFGEEIPYDSLVQVIKEADYRIKDISLDEPNLSTKFCLINNTEIPLSDQINTSEQGNKLYNKLALRNVLAGKISAFEYNNDFISEYDKTSYPKWTDDDGKEQSYALSYPEGELKISSIESSFDVGVAFANRSIEKEENGLVLKENEVIQFRVPNFKTTKTYPAYVNYYIHLKSTNNEDAIPATFMTLANYMEEDNRWENFVNGNDKIKGKLAANTLTITTADKFVTDQANKVVIFKKNNSENYEVIDKYDETISEYYYLPIDDTIFNSFNNWIKNQYGNHKTPEGELKKLDGIYRTSGIQEKPNGRLIDVDLFKYLPAYRFGVVTNKEALDSSFIQVTYDPESDEVKNREVTADGLGKDAKYRGIPINGEYQLDEDEYLLINYTDSKTDESGNEQKNVINKEYTTGDIIRANFNLIDSSLYNNNHSFSKRDNFNFTGHTIQGMFTLGANEQIEIREQVKVELNESTMYLYWTLNSDDPNREENQLRFIESYDGGTNNAYTLKEGEHLYYTNSKKQDLVYYGAGTTIIKSSETPDLFKYASNGEVSEEEIMTNGLAAAIPWQPFDLSGNKKLIIKENQFISLTEGDTIVSIDNSAPTSDISNIWKEIDTAEYIFAEDEVTTTLPHISIKGIKWNVRSRLDFNMSKTVAQPLNRGDKLKITFNTGGTKELVSKEINGNFKVLQVNSNYTCQVANDNIKVDTNIDEADKLKLKISSLESPKIANSSTNVALNNYVNGETTYTKFNFSSVPKISFEDWLNKDGNKDKNEADYNSWLTEQHLAFTLNTYIPDLYGLMLIYYIPDINEQNNSGAYIRALKNAVETNGLTRYNVAATETLDARLSLNAGMNIIKIDKNITHLEIYTDKAKKSTIIFGNLDIIKGINKKLDYRVIDTTNDKTSLDQLLEDIRNTNIAQDFYYNIPIQRHSEIDLNNYIEEEKLSSPISWYDKNNVNRKFVISEIDADYLSTGITLTKTSRV